MGDVYSTTEQVVVWLGEESPDSSWAMYVLSDFKRFKRTLYQKKEPILIGKPIFNVSAALQALGNLFEREWFHSSMGCTRV
jgi:hypothetical protein